MMNDAAPQTAIVLPTYNEAENIEALIAEILQQPGAERFTLIIVDDNSPDRTATLVEQLQRTEPRIELLRRPGKLGLGTAYLAGFRRALERGAELVVTMDADFSHDPRHLPELLRLAPRADLVIGSRYVPGGGVENWPRHRRWLSATANFLARGTLGIASRDCTSGFRCYRAEFLRRVDLDAITSNGYSFLIELLYCFTRRGARIADSPIRFRDRRGGVSKISRTEIFKALKTLWTLYFS